MFIWFSMNSFKHWRFIFCLLVLANNANANANDDIKPNNVSWMPGSSHVISNALSASRDVAYPTSYFTPRQVQRAGIEFALLNVKNSLGEFRFSSAGFIELESNADDADAFYDARHGVDFWRGNYGYGVSQTLDGLANELFSPHSQLELYLG